jgi:hypothetical protein
VIEVWDSPVHIERFIDSGLAEATQEAQIPEPTITEFEVYKLDWVRGCLRNSAASSGCPGPGGERTWSNRQHVEHTE